MVQVLKHSKKKNFLNFSADIKSAFENDETKYMGFSQLLKDYAKVIFF